MSETHRSLWHYDSDFLVIPPATAVAKVISDDAANYREAQKRLVKELALYDRGLTLMTALLQVAQRQQDSWKDDDRVLAAIDLSYSSLNHLLWLRHSILLGYYAEAQSVIRAIHERTTRCLLCRYDLSEAHRYLRGEWQSQIIVDKKLSCRAESEPPARATLLKSLRDRYGGLSEQSHATTIAAEARTGTRDVRSRAGHQCLGGVLSTILARIQLFIALETMNPALAALAAMGRDHSGTWDKAYEGYRSECDSLGQEIMSALGVVEGELKHITP